MPSVDVAPSDQLHLVYFKNVSARDESIDNLKSTAAIIADTTEFLPYRVYLYTCNIIDVRRMVYFVDTVLQSFCDNYFRQEVQE